MNENENSEKLKKKYGLMKNKKYRMVDRWMEGTTTTTKLDRKLCPQSNILLSQQPYAVVQSVLGHENLIR